MRRTVTWVSVHTNAPMGQQHHENELQRALRERAGDDWRFDVRQVGSLRTGRGARVRLPLRAVRAASYRSAAATGRLAYGRGELVHRFDLRLPPRLGREVVTVHDLPPLRFDDEGGLPRWAAEGARDAFGVVCPSAFAAREVESLLGVERTWVVHNGVSPDFSTATPFDGAELRMRGIEGRCVLHAGGATKRKNLAALAEAWSHVAARATDTTLVLCGPPDPRRDRLFADLPRTTFLGHLPSGEVARLMRAASAVVVPSLYEGFGLPALEGMAAGAPVVAANRGALPEVCGDAALFVEPSATAIAAGLLVVLGAQEVAARLRREGPGRAAAFTWSAAADATLAVYEEAVA